MIEVVSEEEGRRIVICMSGLITTADIDAAEENLAQSMAVVGTQKVLLDWTRLEGWEKGAKAVGTWFGMRHWGSVTKVAIVAEGTWEDDTLRIADIYKAADVQRFEPAHRDEAITWLTNGPM